ncbi:hypothetical protein [Sphingomonas sp. Leaf242]|uniref:hypothetical protein n=1 Tax=Sphingomonas sp. Leaf242 TaxID=1736304 RepID=UPI0007163D7A|nr:hypothetical protein [Sphingomonas sp. Leaf242]KQO13418.1 hypothetical protein ASF09_04045 [Sphingomonas sp. Leaf242]
MDSGSGTLGAVERRVSARKARASEMLAALTADRFLLFKEAELIALNIPYDLRRSTQDEALRLRAERPFDPKHLPKMSRAAANYWETVELARAESNPSNTYRKEYLERVKALIARRDALGLFDKPLPAKDGEVIRLWFWHAEYIENWVYSCQSAWDKLTPTDRLWFEDMPPVTRWAWEFPGLAPIPHRFYPTEETPERERQMDLLRWVIENC